jgi:hypothetical protein
MLLGLHQLAEEKICFFYLLVVLKVKNKLFSAVLTALRKNAHS